MIEHFKRKPVSFSAHFAWGAFLSLWLGAATGHASAAWALGVALGPIWEAGSGWLRQEWRRRKGLPSSEDWKPSLPDCVPYALAGFVAAAIVALGAV